MNNVHPYQSQIDRMWDLIGLRIRALKNGFWIEAITLTYILLEVELRLLLTSKAGAGGQPLASLEIDKEAFLISLASLALKHGFIDENLHQEIASFNKTRNDAIHGLIQGRIAYQELENLCVNSSNIIGRIQSLWLPMTIGPEERI